MISVFFFLCPIPEYKPSMEILAVGFQYDNETTTLRVSVYVGIPDIKGNTYSPSTSGKELVFATPSSSNFIAENFTNFEIYLTALPNEISSEPPSSCLNDNFLQHSSRNVIVGCGRTKGTSRSDKRPADDNQTSCVGRDVVKHCINSVFLVHQNLLLCCLYLPEEFHGYV